jgi:hypothetical protein
MDLTLHASLLQSTSDECTNCGVAAVLLRVLLLWGASIRVQVSAMDLTFVLIDLTYMFDAA